VEAGVRRQHLPRARPDGEDERNEGKRRQVPLVPLHSGFD